MNLPDLPEDTLVMIFGQYLGSLERVVASYVCTSLRSLIRGQLPLSVGEFRNVCIDASSQGYLDVLIWANDFGFPCDKHVYSAAARNGHLHVIQWLHQNKCPNERNGKKMILAAASAGHLHILKWAHKNEYIFHPQEYDEAARSGHLDILKWLHRKGLKCGFMTAGLAAERGHLKVLKWLYRKKYNINTHEYNRAVFGGHLHIIKWIYLIHGHHYDYRNFWQQCTAKTAAHSGNLEMFQYLISIGCQWGNLHCSTISEMTHLPAERMQEMLDWARANGCPE